MLHNEIIETVYYNIKKTSSASNSELAQRGITYKFAKNAYEALTEHLKMHSSDNFNVHEDIQ